MKKITLECISPLLHFARYIDITPDYGYNGIIAYDARMLCVLSGKGGLMVEDSVYRLEPGTLICWQAGSEYGFQDISQPLRVIMLNFDFSGAGDPVKRTPDTARDFDAARIDNTPALTMYADRAGVYIDREAYYAEPLMRELVNEYTARKVCWESVSRGIITSLVSRLIRAARRGNDHRVATDDVIAYINAHLGERLTYESLGKVFSYHPNHLSRMILESTGMPLHRYIQKLRIERAYGMLCDEGKSVAEAARLCGFSDPAAFAKRFRLETGMTPSEAARVRR